MDPIITSALTAFVTASATKGMNAPMQTLDDLWYLAFGDISQLANMKRAKNEINTAQYKDSILRKTLEIKPENLQEPPMSIVGPALEASKYYIEEEELREMFANVIAASMDKTKSGDVHHSFVEIIKQLSPRDAHNISLFKNRSAYPVVKYILQNKMDKKFIVIAPLVFLSNFVDGIIDEKDSASISNLIRLGLLEHSIDTLTSVEEYAFYEKESYLDSLISGYDKEVDEVVTRRNSLSVTPLGNLFMKVCL
ncbi:uncharacterized protein DUF4393 [Planomicrobium soli]|uniref:Uncharacterized protein DUF4393 n=1 Tax=Planomicrobium soli TaxID=1176648 RepID=A0A2P8H4K0_9BACL|nr:DUF4393 domain-containing protein [Planomicrobium soli]PSL41155.1 uncharacterized protein DUF4393 [Planomicrobium soli]